MIDMARSTRTGVTATNHDGALFVVEDDPQIVDLIAMALRQSGFRAVPGVARDGLVAVETLLAIVTVPQLVLLDLNLPGLGGLEVVSRLRAHPRTAFVPIVILTSSDDEADMREAYRRGANSFVAKPMNFSAFVDTLGALWRYWLLVNQSAPCG